MDTHRREYHLTCSEQSLLCFDSINLQRTIVLEVQTGSRIHVDRIFDRVARVYVSVEPIPDLVNPTTLQSMYNSDSGHGEKDVSAVTHILSPYRR